MAGKFHPFPEASCLIVIHAVKNSKNYSAIKYPKIPPHSFQTNTQRGTVEWVPLFLHEDPIPFAEIDPVSRHVRLCAGQELLDQQDVVFHDV